MANIEQLNKIRALEKSGSTSSNKTIFENLRVCYLDSPVKEHFPKVLNADGTKKKDENGNDLRSDRADGFIFTFSEIGTSQVVKVVLQKKYKLELDQFYSVGGKGYRIRSGNLIFIDEAGSISAFK